MARATSSLPVPLGPTMRTVAGVGAAFATSARSRADRLAVPHDARDAEADFSSRFSRTRRVESRTRRSAFRTCSDDSGFSRKSSAPAWTASMAVFTSPWPEMTMTGVAIPRPRHLRERLQPVLAGHLDVEEPRHRGPGPRKQRSLPKRPRSLVPLVREERAKRLADIRSSSQTRMRRASRNLAARRKRHPGLEESGAFRPLSSFERFFGA